MELEDNYYNIIYTKFLEDVDNKEFRNSAMRLYEIVREHFHPDGIRHYDGQSTMTTGLYRYYNTFLYPFPEFSKAFNQLKQLFEYVTDVPNEYYIQSWLNVYKKSEYIDWHSHWPAGINAWHGLFIVDSEAQESFTKYRVGFPDGTTENIDIESKNNLLILGKCENDFHRSTEWDNDKERITIAYDIVPSEYVDNQLYLNTDITKLESYDLNHWIPFTTIN